MTERVRTDTEQNERLQWLRDTCADHLDMLAEDLEESGADFPNLTVIVRNPAKGPGCYSIVTNEPDEVADRLREALASPEPTP